MIFWSRLFQSTPSARRATHEGRQLLAAVTISIHALREESDLLSMGIVPGMCLFQSTPSARRATAEGSHHQPRAGISIHALREESDRAAWRSARPYSNFNPRPPRGERPTSTRVRSSSSRFQSTPSARRATGRKSRKAPMEQDFNPRPPRGERRSTTRHQSPGC